MWLSPFFCGMVLVLGSGYLRGGDRWRIAGQGDRSCPYAMCLLWLGELAEEAERGIPLGWGYV